VSTPHPILSNIIKVRKREKKTKRFVQSAAVEVIFFNHNFVSCLVESLSLLDGICRNAAVIPLAPDLLPIALELALAPCVVLVPPALPLAPPLLVLPPALPVEVPAEFAVR
jgi:hypothetical protein